MNKPTPDEALKVASIILRTQRKHKTVGNITPEALSDIKETLQRLNLQATDDQITDGWKCLFYPIHYKVTPEEYKSIRVNL